MNPDHCPLCYERLEVRDVAPCWDCGWQPKELEHARAGVHTYAEWRVIDDLRLVLCNFCDVDIYSYDPTFFGFRRGERLWSMKMEKLRIIYDATISKDKFCPNCSMRLAFLEFVVKAREANAPKNEGE